MAIVYLHKRKVDDVVFYVGVGSKDKRAYDKNRRGKFWKDYTSKHEYLVEIIHRDIPLAEAFEIEKSLIATYGRRDLGKGSLVNQTDGGEGMKNLSPEARTKLAANKGKFRELNYFYGKKHTGDLSRFGVQNIGKTPWMKGKTHDEAAILKIKHALKGMIPKNKDSVCVNNGTINKYVSQEQIKEYVACGWIIGGKQKPSMRGIPSKSRKSIQHIETGIKFNSHHDASKYFGVSESTITRWVKQGKFKQTKQ